MTRVVLAEIPESCGRDLSIERSILGSDVEIVRYSYDGSEEDLISACEDADIVFTEYAPLTRNVLERMPKCRLISFSATGYDSVDLQAAKDVNISVCAVDEYCTNEVADHVLLLILALCRRLPEYHEQVQQEKLWQGESLTGLVRMSSLTLGIVGFGRIGQAVARRAHGFGMTIIAHDPHPDTGRSADDDVEFCDLKALFAKADIISLNCGLTANNRRLVDATAFRQMARRPILINCARGGLIDEAALLEALDTGQISAAGLDVLDDDSPDLRATKLIGRSNVLLTPHIAYYSDTSLLECRNVSASNIRHCLDGRHEKVRRYIYHAAD